MQTAPRRRLRTVISILSNSVRRGPVRLEGSLLVVTVLARAKVDLAAAVSEGDGPVKVHVVNILGVTDVRLPATVEVKVTRLPLGWTRVSRPALLPS